MVIIMKLAPVNKIIPFSNVDGPGNRTAVFFQGCTFDCKFCHNPETINMCIGCSECVSKCPAGALSCQSVESARAAADERSADSSTDSCKSPDADAGMLSNRRGSIIWDSTKCVQCDTCIRVCQSNASPRIRYMSVPDLIAEIRRTAPYIQGITVSGGECTLQNDFLIDLFSAVRALQDSPRLTCLLDSNGSFDFEADPRILEVSEGVMLDVKAVGKEWSRRLIGDPGDLVLKNLDYLLKAEKLQEVRTVIIPGRDTENEETVRYTASKIGNACDYRIIRYRPFGVRENFQKELGEDETPEEYAMKFVELAKQYGAGRAYLV